MLLVRAVRIDWLEQLDDLWIDWDRWFVELEETHTLERRPALLPQPAPRALVDHGGGLRARHRLAPRSACSTCPAPSRPSCASARASSPCATSPTPSTSRTTPIPQPGDPISVTRAEFDEVWDAPGRRGRAARAPIATRPGATSPAGGSTTTSVLVRLCALDRRPHRALVLRPRRSPATARSAWAAAAAEPVSPGGRRGGGEAVSSSSPTQVRSPTPLLHATRQENHTWPSTLAMVASSVRVGALGEGAEHAPAA